MKNFKLLIVLCSSLIFMSCEKDPTLDGTSWQRSYYFDADEEVVDDNYLIITFNFTSDNTGNRVNEMSLIGNQTTSTTEFNYTYDGTSITIITDDHISKGTVIGNRLELDENVYTKL